MNTIFKMALIVINIAIIPQNAYSQDNSTLNLHSFERVYAQAGVINAGYDRLHEVLPVGSDAVNAVTILRDAGAHCQSPNPRRSGIDCYYRELLSVDDYVNTYATWDIRLDIDAGKVSAVSVARATEQHS